MTPVLKLVTLFVRISDLCKGKMIKRHVGRGRPCQLFREEIVTIIVWFMLSKVRSFKEFYVGAQGDFLRQFFPRMMSYSAFLKQLKKHSREIWSMATAQAAPHRPRRAYIDSTPLPVCENIRSGTHRTFAGTAQWAHSSVSTKFGLKLHVLVSEDQKILNFVLKPGAMHDVSCAEEVLCHFQGTVIGDKGYCSGPLAKRLRSKKIRLVARHRKNMQPNTAEERVLLKRRSLVETVIGKFKDIFGATLSRFRSPQAAFAAICAGVLAINLGGR
jgi:IS5 family transposase